MFDAVLSDAGIQVARSGVRMPRIRTIMKWWVPTCHELLDHTLSWNQRHLLHALREFGQFCNEHRAHQGDSEPASVTLATRIDTEPGKTARLDVRLTRPARRRPAYRRSTTTS